VKQILIISTHYPTAVDPVKGIFVQRQVQALQKDFKITVIAPQPWFPRIPLLRRWSKYATLPDKVVEQGVEVYYSRYLLFPRNLFYDQIGVLLAWSVSGLLNKLNRKQHFDLIHAHFSYPDGYAAFRAAKMLRLPLIITEHRGLFPEQLKRKQTGRFISEAFSYASAIVCVSKHFVPIAASAVDNKDKVKWIPNSIDTDRYRLRTSSDLSPYRLITVTHLLETKGVQYLLQALRSVIRDFPKVQLTIIGDGPHRPVLEALAKSNILNGRITFLGYLPTDEMVKHLESADVFIQPSLRESFSIVVLEALACGFPVVATRCGGPEFLVGEEDGILVPPADSGALAEGIVGILMRYDSYDSSRIRERCREQYDDRVVLTKLSALYEEKT
jgi:teichuronic acid biosynthesis glycosyltransferase TuaC